VAHAVDAAVHADQVPLLQSPIDRRWLYPGIYQLVAADDAVLA
jgi:hypothetical protein